ncbi:MAG TPA: chemotaxis protein CheW [Candidatus Saccharimonadales bacterium]|jgi:chemotaxis signal transduction protein|nr:chemotaxis protein CheW [Candidatus Saccharimonadales bacterium]
MSDQSAMAGTAAALRAAFDRTYALPSQTQQTSKTEDLLAIRLAGAPYALRVREIAGLANHRRPVALPSGIPELLGVAGLRGELVPVYSLAALLDGHRGTEEVRWLALCRAEDPIGLAFADFEGYLQVPLAEIYAANHDHLAHPSVYEVTRSAGVVRSVISIPAILEMVKRRCGKERV